MKKAISVLAVFFISFQLNAQWVSQTSGVTTNLPAISAVDSNICWIAGYNGVVLRTTNGGTTWKNVGGGPVIGSIDNTNIYAIDSNTCLVTSFIDHVVTYVYKTTDGGISWKQVFTQTGGSNVFISAILMTTAANGFMVGDPVNLRWSLWKTTDGETTWDSIGLALMTNSYVDEVN